MKVAFFLFALFAIASANQAKACSLPPDATYIQPAQYIAVMNSREVLDTFRRLGAKDIKSVSVTNNGYQLASTNGCYVTARVVYVSNPYPGACPKLAGVEITGRGCIR